MKKNKSLFRYKNIFLQSSLQFCGNIEEYFVSHTEKLVIFIVMPRVKNKGNVIRQYNYGKLMEEKPFSLSENIFLYYLGWYIQYFKVLNKYYSKKEPFFAIVFHPIFFFGMSTQKLWRSVNFVYWVGDYFPNTSKVIIMFEKLKKFYHGQGTYACYISDAINEIMNGKILESDNRKTVMWGVKPKSITRTFDRNNFNILFVGLIKESQGLEFFYDFLKENKEYKLKIIGVCEKKLYTKYMSIIKRYDISDRVYFPNKFFSDKELNEISEECQIGIALYDANKSSVTYYADPGKVKAYAELGLPIIMSNIPSVAPYIRKFNAGEIVDRNEISLRNALKKIRDNYQKYIDGVNKFNRYFYFEDYYKRRFKFLEKVA
ncbi:MAG TPA: hypothetical protein VMR77_03215 [Patescibacteria group bacterium]|nr:hypothetical protein [Patescibacteria group bacterium]